MSRRVSIVAGGSRGIGAAVVRGLAQDGHDVVIGYVQDVAAAEKLAAEVAEGGARAIAVRADVSDPRDVENLFTEAETAFGGVDVVVAAAGAHAAQRGPIATTDDDSFQRVTGVNFRGTFNVLRTAATRVRTGGRIVTFSSSAAKLGVPGQAVYNAAKVAVESLTHQYAKELAGKGITANVVAPGPTATELFLSRMPREQIDALAKQVPLGRIGTPQDVAGVVAFLAGEAGGWVNGQVLHANGGVA
jgi:3-oxoacyl-[acyl-carrier protein] reductase